MTSRWFGDYEIVKQLRAGGMATLYLARRHGAAGFTRLVVLKLIHPHLIEQPSFLEMFVDEARICSRLSHSNAVHVEEFGSIDNVPYLVMEYIDGCSVSDLLSLLRHEHRALDPELSARVIMMVASGLHAAHETLDQDGQPLDILHRDISPSNILLSLSGNAKLIDFGIARARNRMAETEVGAVLKGKYRYMAPEQATRSTVDRRCDIFSLGIVFWEMLVGRSLFPEEDHAALFNRLERTEVVPPSELNPAVPIGLDLIVLAMLRHDPADRPQTAAEVQRRIAAAMPGAANRAPAELGALALDVRDKREAWRASRRAAGEDPDSHRSFSPTPRSARSLMAARLPDLEVSPPPEAVSPPTPWWAPPPRLRRAIQLGAIAGVVISAVLVIATHRRASRAPAVAVHAPASVAAAPVTAAPVAAAPAAAKPTAAPSDDRPDDHASSPPPAPAPALAKPAAPAPLVRTGRARPSQIRQPPAERVKDTTVARPASPRPPSGTVVDLPFDDADNQRAVPTESSTATDTTPIATDFDN